MAWLLDLMRYFDQTKRLVGPRMDAKKWIVDFVGDLFDYSGLSEIARSNCLCRYVIVAHAMGIEKLVLRIDMEL